MDIMEEKDIVEGAGHPIRKAFEELLARLDTDAAPCHHPVTFKRYKPSFPKRILWVNEHTTVNIIEQERPNIVAAHIESNDRAFLLIAIPLTPYPEEGEKR